MSVIGSNIIAGASGTVETGYQISRSLRFNSADSAYLNRTPGSAGNRKTWTWRGYVKRSGITVSSTNVYLWDAGGVNVECPIAFNTSDNIEIWEWTGSAYAFRLITTQVFRDPSAFYDIQVAFDTTQATAANRIKLWVNGVQVTAFSTASYPSQNYDTLINSAVQHTIGRAANSSARYFPGYLADVRLIDGQALDPTSFGEFDSATGVWVPKAYTGTYGTNGFWLKFDDNSGVTATTLGKDSSGNGNNWTPNNFSVTAGVGNDSLVDSPTNYGTDTGAGGEVRGNYATWNPLDKDSNTTLVNGNLDASYLAAAWAAVRATFGLTSGKWYWEVTPTTLTTSITIGIGKADSALSFVGASATSWGYYSATGVIYNNSSSTAYGASYAVNNVIGVALDLDNGTLTFYKNGTSQGTAVTGLTSGPYFPMVGHENAASSANFGQRPFAYAAPSGFKALCTTNLPTPAIGASASTLANKNFDATLWTGTGASLNVVNDGAFAPDFVWTKPRNAAVGHTLFDTIRGVTKYLQSNTAGAEGTAATSLTAFNSNGFTVNSDTSTGANGSTYVGWQWKAGGAGVSNTAGSITSTVSANTSAGISVVTYTGNGSAGTIGHGLGVAPKMVIAKRRDNVSDWAVYHVGLTSASYYVYLNSTQAQALATGIWNGTAPTSSVASIGSIFSANGGTYVAYCFAEVAGFSKFGSYTGNGSADGPFVFTGMRSRWVLIKRTDAAGDNWFLYDTARNTYNVADLRLYPNTSGAEASGINAMDILSNGFKLRTTDTSFNASGGTYIFAAFAEAPFNYARAR